MTPTPQAAVDRLTTRAEAAGLRVLAAAAWPESPADTTPPPIPGFVISTFSPLAAATAARCLTRATPPAARAAGNERADDASPAPAAVDPVPRGAVSGGVAVPAVGGVGDERAARAAAAAVEPGSRVPANSGRVAAPAALAGPTAGSVPMAVVDSVPGGSVGDRVAAPAAPAVGTAGHVSGAVAPVDPVSGGSATTGRVAAPAAPAGSGTGALASGLAAPAPAAGAGAGVGRVMRTAVVMVSAFGDVVGAMHVADVVDRGGRPGPLMFFQAVPNAVGGHVAVRWGLEGAVVCVGDVGAGVEVAEGLIEDGDADEVLVVWVEQLPDRAEAVLVAGAGAGSGVVGGEWG